MLACIRELSERNASDAEGNDQAARKATHPREIVLARQPAIVFRPLMATSL